MKNIEINLGRACDNRCVFCANGEISARERGWMRIESVEEELGERRSEGAESKSKRSTAMPREHNSRLMATVDLRSLPQVKQWAKRA